VYEALAGEIGVFIEL